MLKIILKTFYRYAYLNDNIQFKKNHLMKKFIHIIRALLIKIEHCTLNF